MDSCDAYQPLLADVLFGGSLSSEERARLEAHLSECEACTRALREMRETLGVMDRRTRPGPPSGFWEAFEDNLGDRLEAPSRSDSRAVSSSQASSQRPAARRSDSSVASGPGAWLRERLGSATRRLARQPAWARYGALAIGALLVGIVLGRTVLEPASGTRRTAAALEQRTGAPTSTVRRARLHLARSKVLLIEFAAFDPDRDSLRTLRLGGKRAQARSLATESEQIRAALNENEHGRLRTLVGELGKVLRQIAALDGLRTLDGIASVQTRLKDGDLILRINLEELRLASTLPVLGFSTAAR